MSGICTIAGCLSGCAGCHAVVLIEAEFALGLRRFAAIISGSSIGAWGTREDSVMLKTSVFGNINDTCPPYILMYM